MTKIRSGDSSMIDDRRGSGGGGVLSGLGGGGFPIPIRAGGGVLGIIVLLASLLLPRLLGSTQSAASVPQAADKAAASDGACNSDLEQIVCGATADVQAYWQANLPAFYGTTYEPTKTVFFTNSTNTGCGQASSQTGPFYCPADHLVYLDLGFMQALEQQLVGTTSDLAEQYIVPTSTATTSRTWSASATRCSKHSRTIPAGRISIPWRRSCKPTASPGCGSAMLLHGASWIPLPN